MQALLSWTKILINRVLSVFWNPKRPKKTNLKAMKMSADRIYLTVAEQTFLMEMFEVDDPSVAVDKFAALMSEERADPQELHKYLKKIIKNGLK